jgi:hypothetical protein
MVQLTPPASAVPSTSIIDSIRIGMATHTGRDLSYRIYAARSRAHQLESSIRLAWKANISCGERAKSAVLPQLGLLSGTNGGKAKVETTTSGRMTVR